MPSAQASPAGVPGQPKRVVTGADVPNQYGDVQVRLTLSGHQIVRVAAVKLPDADGRSQDISAYYRDKVLAEAQPLYVAA